MAGAAHARSDPADGTAPPPLVEILEGQPMINFASIALTRFIRLRRLMTDPVVTVTPEVEQEPPFFMVWWPNGGSPVHKHFERDYAEREAERVARLHPESDVFVMAPTTRVRAKRAEREDYAPAHSADCMCSRCEVPF
jgi:hypothetical protein